MRIMDLKNMYYKSLMCLNFLLNLSTLDYLTHLDNVHPQSRIFLKVPNLFILSLFERELRSLVYFAYEHENIPTETSVRDAFDDGEI